MFESPPEQAEQASEQKIVDVFVWLLTDKAIPKDVHKRTLTVPADDLR